MEIGPVVLLKLGGKPSRAERHFEVAVAVRFTFFPKEASLRWPWGIELVSNNLLTDPVYHSLHKGKETLIPK